MLKALLVILGIAKKRDAAREEEKERESWWCWLEHEREHEREHARTLAQTFSQDSRAQELLTC